MGWGCAQWTFNALFSEALKMRSIMACSKEKSHVTQKFDVGFSAREQEICVYLLQMQTIQILTHVYNFYTLATNILQEMLKIIMYKNSGIFSISFPQLTVGCNSNLGMKPVSTNQA